MISYYCFTHIYPLVICNIAIENGMFEWENQL